MNRLKFGMGIVGLAMVSSTVFKDEIEPLRVAAQDIQNSVIAAVVSDTVQIAPIPPAIK